MFGVGLVLVSLICLAAMLSRRVRNNRFWRAMVTPLASIIGSGFLVVVPLLGHAVGRWAPVAMAGVVLLAYLIGHVIRFNIRHSSSVESGRRANAVRRLEVVSSIALALSYFVSVTFYLRLLASFALRAVGHEDELLARILTTAIIATISLLGWFRGLSLLERLEQYSVSVKLSIIAALLVGWAVHDATLLGAVETSNGETKSTFELVRTLAGVLIVVQGFETSRYLGSEYGVELRVRSMRAAQLASAVIYVVFVALCVPTMQFLPEQIDETAIIGLSAQVSVVLPVLLVIAAIMSQFSAAVADTVGAGGLVSEQLGRYRPTAPRVGYAAVGVVAIVLVWSADIFQIVALASRAFALYYASQSLVAAVVAYGKKRWGLLAWFCVLSALLAAVAVLAKPAG